MIKNELEECFYMLYRPTSKYKHSWLFLELGLFLAKKLSIGPCSAMMIFVVYNLLLKYLPI